MIFSTTTYKNGGIEQGILQIIEDHEELELSAADKKRLDYLKSLPQNRTEIDAVHEIHTIKESQ